MRYVFSLDMRERQGSNLHKGKKSYKQPFFVPVLEIHRDL